MRKKEKIKNFIAETANRVRNEVIEELNKELFIANTHKNRAEQELIDTFSNDQKILYSEYINACQRCYDILIEIQNIKKNK